MKPAAARVVERGDTHSLPAPARPADPQSPPQPAAEPRIAPFIASPLRQPVDPDLQHSPTPGFRPQAVEAPPKTDVAQPASADRAVGRVHLEFAGDRKSSPIPWRPVGIATGVIVAVGFIGAWAGSNDTNASAPQQPGRTVTVALPQPTPPQATMAPAPTEVEVQPERRTRAVVAVARAEGTPVAQPPLADQQVALSEPSEADTKASDEAVAPAPPVAADAAHLPLANAVIARTIGRIGYACFQVLAPKRNLE